MALYREMSPVLDDAGLRLADELQRNGRATDADLAKVAGLSASAVAERMRRLGDAGVIRSYRADIDPEGLGYTMSALIRPGENGKRR